MYPRGVSRLGATTVPDVPGPVSGSTNYTTGDYAMMWAAMSSSNASLPPNSGGDRLWAETQAWHAAMLDMQTRSNIVLQKGYMIAGGASSDDPSGPWAVHPPGDLQTVVTMLMTVPIATLEALPNVREIAQVYDPVAHQVTAPAAPTGPPAGWHQSPPTSENPSGGWYGSDGLFYTGTAPWSDPYAVGRSVVTPPPPPAPLPPPPSTQPAVSKTTAPGQPATQPIEQPPIPGANMPLDVFPGYGPVPWNATDLPGSTPAGAAPIAPGGTVFAGMSGGTLLLVGGAVVGLLLMGRKKGGRR